MAQGIAIPLRVRNGRLAKLSGDDYIDQLVRTALKGLESDNPFQTPGLGEFMVFGVNDHMSEGEIREKVIAIFESFRLDQLARLDNPESDVTFEHVGEEMVMHLSYRNLETQERTETSVPIPTGE